MVPEILSLKGGVCCHFGPFFAHLPRYGLRKSNFLKNRITPGDITILKMCTINYNHMIYGP